MLFSVKVFFKNSVILITGLASIFLAATSLADSYAIGKKEAIATAHPLATQAGIQSLQLGGNAFDAAIAITAALSSAEPYSSGIGGGGFYLIYNAKKNSYTFLDAREKAPLKAHKDMYLDANGEVIKGASVTGALAAGIPGIPAALEYLNKKLALLPLAANLQAAVNIAEKGFQVSPTYNKYGKWRFDDLKQFPLLMETYFPGSKVPEIDDTIVQKKIAKTLRTLARKGIKEFYTGKIAKEMVRAVKAAGGLWTMEDLKKYSVIERQPIVSNHKAGKLISAPPPSSGGVVISQVLNQLEAMGAFKKSEQEFTHLFIEAMRRAYRDRAVYMGDTDFVDVPISRLISKDYASGLVASIHPKKASKSEWFTSKKDGAGGFHTTHFSVKDKRGNIVAATLSINYPFGSGIIAGDTGVLLNDEMDDFVAKPNVPNVYGLVGGEANAIEGGKRMLSSMSPTIFIAKDKTLILGTPGGSRIISMVLQVLFNSMKGMDAKDMIDEPRLHHQYLPDYVRYEKNTFSEDMISYLQGLGHELKQKGDSGNFQVIVLHKNGEIEAASDRRGIGKAWSN